MADFQQISVDERVRVLESRYSLMRDRLFLINQNMIQEYRKLNKEIKLIDSEIKEVKLQFNEIKHLLNNIVNEMQNFAKKDNVKVIEKYLDFWNPMKFTTEKDVIEIIDRGEKHSKGHSNRES